MSLPAYPRRGWRIAPAALNKILHVQIPPALAKRIGRHDLQLADLDERSWEWFDEATCRELADLVVRQVPSRSKDLPPQIRHSPIPALPSGTRLPHLGLGHRAFNALRRHLSSRRKELSDLTVGDLLEIRNLGVRSLLEILVALEARAVIPSSPGASVVGQATRHETKTELAPDELKYATIQVWRNGQLVWMPTSTSDQLPVVPWDFAVDDLQIRHRTRNLLDRHGFTEHPGRLREVTIGYLLQLPGFGSTSLSDLVQAMEKLVDSPSVDEEVRRAAAALGNLPGATDVRRSDPRLGAHIDRIVRSGETLRDAALRLSNGRTSVLTSEALRSRLVDIHTALTSCLKMTLDEELLTLAIAISGERNGRVFVRYHGWDGRGGATLQQVADEVGLTRERVRQVCNKVTLRLADTDPFVPIAREVMTLASSAFPTSSSELSEQLVNARRIPSGFDVAVLPVIAKQLNLDCPFTHIETGGIGLFVADGDQDTPRTVLRLARRAVTEWGATTIDDLADQAGVPSEFVRTIVEMEDDFCWLDEATGWFWLSKARRNRLIKRIEKVLAVAGIVQVGELRTLVAKDYRMAGVSPPKRVLLALCSQQPGYQVEGESITVMPPLDWEAVLADGEETIVRVLKANGGVMAREQLEATCLMQGLSRENFSGRLTYSPIVLRLAPEVYALPGAQVAPGQVEGLIPRRRPSRIVLDHGWTDGGRLWLAYRLSQGMLGNGVASVPAAIRSFVQGEFALIVRDGARMGKMVVRDSAAWGLHPFFRRRGAEPDDILLMVFDLSTHHVTLWLGGEELLEGVNTGAVPL